MQPVSNGGLGPQRVDVLALLDDFRFIMSEHTLAVQRPRL
jgi:hypothetical protein